MTEGDDRSRDETQPRPDREAAQAVLPAGSLELDEVGDVRLARLIDRMSEGRHSAAALDRMAALVARLLVPDRLVAELLQDGPAVRP